MAGPVASVGTDDSSVVVTAARPDNEASAAAAFIPAITEAAPGLFADNNVGPSKLPPVEQMGLLLTRPEVALPPDDCTRPEILPANPAAVPRPDAGKDEDGAVDLASDDMESREEGRVEVVVGA